MRLTLTRKPKPAVSNDIPFGVDPASAGKRIDFGTVSIAAIAVAALVAAYTFLGGPVRDDRNQIAAELAEQQQIRDDVATRLAEARDSASDSRIELLTTNAQTLDRILPYSEAANDIETFEIQLPGMLSSHGLEATELSRGAGLSDSGDGTYLPLRVSLTGSRPGLFSWLGTLQDLERLVTIHNLQFSFGSDDPSRITAQAQLRMWYSQTPTLPEVEQRRLAGMDLPSEEPSAENNGE